MPAPAHSRSLSVSLDQCLLPVHWTQNKLNFFFVTVLQRELQNRNRFRSYVHEINTASTQQVESTWIVSISETFQTDCAGLTSLI